MCVPMADSCYVWQKPTQHCKAIILQLKINKFKKKVIKRAILASHPKKFVSFLCIISI